MESKDHAIHNEETCDFLLQSGKFNDWALTTAFYSALHYVCYELFPMEIDNVNYDCFERYYRLSSNNSNNSKSKHKVIIALVKTHIPSCNMLYRSLYDQCMTARYNNYKVSGEFALKARKDLDRLKRQLDKLSLHDKQ